MIFRPSNLETQTAHNLQNHYMHNAHVNPVHLFENTGSPPSPYQEKLDRILF